MLKPLVNNGGASFAVHMNAPSTLGRQHVYTRLVVWQQVYRQFDSGCACLTIVAVATIGYFP